MFMLDGVKTLNDTIPKVLSQNLSAHNVELNNPFIVVEGLDGTGKSTITQNLCEHFNVCKVVTPPDSIRHIRKKFDHLPELCRRAYYSFSNYMAAKEVLDVIRTRPVVMDRYWHSTTAYAIAKEVAVGIEHHLPDEGDSLYAWPEDLLRPSAVLFLTTPEKHRDVRVNEREDVTAEEKEISENERLRMRIMKVYQRFGNTKWVEVDTSGTKEESLQIAIKGLADVGVELTKREC
ncbi:UMP-CMP kinase 2, mitochondrial-like isoform X2 [Hydractinia symbiolongicarpus]|nr:UMP-CMP kinase 2, mitochondrial-like isoform X2 [Hydractinia symbiolongicarpus]XP_057314992.1 UMP-CMP kinase 2, mitochondrial-like isoform X2 [Hydractinia symbiolongicarpus]